MTDAAALARAATVARPTLAGSHSLAEEVTGIRPPPKRPPSSSVCGGRRCVSFC